MFRNRNEEDNYMYEACDSTCNECTSKYEVENPKEGIVVEKEELIKNKEMENKEKIRRKKT